MPSLGIGILYGGVGGIIGAIVLAIIMNMMASKLKANPPAIMAKKMFGDEAKKPMVLFMVMTIWGVIAGIVLTNGTLAPTYTNGLLFAAIPYLVLNLMMLPMAGAGLFGTKAWNKMWMTSLVMHAIWGLIVVGVYNALVGLVG